NRYAQAMPLRPHQLCISQLSAKPMITLGANTRAVVNGGRIADRLGKRMVQMLPISVPTSAIRNTPRPDEKPSPRNAGSSQLAVSSPMTVSILNTATARRVESAALSTASAVDAERTLLEKTTTATASPISVITSVSRI